MNPNQPGLEKPRNLDLETAPVETQIPSSSPSSVEIPPENPESPITTIPESTSEQIQVASVETPPEQAQLEETQEIRGKQLADVVKGDVVSLDDARRLMEETSFSD